MRNRVWTGPKSAERNQNLSGPKMCHEIHLAVKFEADPGDGFPENDPDSRTDGVHSYVPFRSVGDNYLLGVHMVDLG